MATTAQRRDFEALVASVHEPLMRYLGRRAPAADADDVMGDVLLTLWRRLDDVPQVDPLPWCYGVARRALANHRRGSERRGRLLERLRRQPPAVVDLSGADEQPELAAALAALPDADRELLVLWAWEQLEPREIATVLQITPNAASVRLSRARKKVARHMTRKDPASSGHKGVGHTGEHRP
jgi:RNA polymerase sigma-70 factor (ECF subfamily)